MDKVRDLNGPGIFGLSEAGNGAPSSAGGSGDDTNIKYMFASGGVMTPRGPMALRRFAGGGTGASPMLALFGEGARNEAFVPLPDGRSIPVAMGGAGSNGAIVVNNTVNLTATGGTAEQNDDLARRVGEQVGESLRGVLGQQ